MNTTASWEQYRDVREFLRSRYSEEIAAAALGVRRIADFDKRDPRAPIRDTLVRFFFGGAAVPTNEFHRSVPAAALDAMNALGLINQSGDHVWCPYIVYPTHGQHLISDRFMNPEGAPITGQRDFVYFALTANTQAYLEMLPKQPCEAFLDVGAGCGAAALVQGSVARTSVATDISERSAEFALFNARLNDMSNVESLQGSLYEPVAGRRFDRIGCHPPYDITSSSPWTFADGGDDGEFVIRGVVQGLPEHLTEGGEFYGLFRGGDRQGEPLEQRVRGWLGERHAEFDIGLVVRGIVEVQDYVIGSILSSSRDFNLFEATLRRFAELKVERLVYASLIVRRKQDRSAPLTLRRDLGRSCGAAELAWLLDWDTAAPTLDLNGFTLEPSPDMELIVRHRTKDGDLRPVEYKLRAYSPFLAELDCPEWVALLVNKCAGGRTTQEVYADLHGAAPLNEQQFQAAVKRLIAAGVIQLASGSKITSSS